MPGCWCGHCPIKLPGWITASQGGVQILAGVPRGDVPVIMQLQFQQSFVEYVEVPELQFIDRVVVASSCVTETGLPVQIVQQTMEISQVPFLALLLTRPLLCNHRCLGAHAWFDSGCIFCVSLRRGLWKISHIFYVKVELWILRSILVSSCKHGRRGSGRFCRLHGSGMHSAGFAGEICVPNDCRHDGMHTLRSVHSRWKSGQ